MKIEFINHPYVFTNDGKRIAISHIDGMPKVGAALEAVGERYNVVANDNDSECVGGVCPIR